MIEQYRRRLVWVRTFGQMYRSRLGGWEGGSGSRETNVSVIGMEWLDVVRVGGPV